MIAAALFIGAMVVVVVLLVTFLIAANRNKSSQALDGGFDLNSDSSADLTLLTLPDGSSTSAATPDFSGHAGAHHAASDCGHTHGSGFDGGHSSGGDCGSGGHH